MIQNTTTILLLYLYNYAEVSVYIVKQSLKTAYAKLALKY
jgi:hypothetical protein